VLAAHVQKQEPRKAAQMALAAGDSKAQTQASAGPTATPSHVPVNVMPMAHASQIATPTATEPAQITAAVVVELQVQAAHAAQTTPMEIAHLARYV